MTPASDSYPQNTCDPGPCLLSVKQSWTLAKIFASLVCRCTEQCTADIETLTKPGDRDDSESPVTEARSGCPPGCWAHDAPMVGQ